jgi:hypothetical protein
MRVSGPQKVFPERKEEKKKTDRQKYQEEKYLSFTIRTDFLRI